MIPIITNYLIQMNTHNNIIRSMNHRINSIYYFHSNEDNKKIYISPKLEVITDPVKLLIFKWKLKDVKYIFGKNYEITSKLWYRERHKVRRINDKVYVDGFGYIIVKDIKEDDNLITVYLHWR